MSLLAMVEAWAQLHGLRWGFEDRPGLVPGWLVVGSDEGTVDPATVADLTDIINRTNYPDITDGYKATSKAVASDPTATAEQLRVASILYLAEVKANPALPLLAIVEPLKLGHLLGGAS